MKITKNIIDIESHNQIQFLDVTDKIRELLEMSGIRRGMVTVYSPHTTMGVVINHNEPMLLQDFMRILYRVAPVDDQYSHDLFELRRGRVSDGRSNGHSHCKTLMTGNSETIPIDRGDILLGKNQSVFAVEFDGARKRDIIVQIIGVE